MKYLILTGQQHALSTLVIHCPEFISRMQPKVPMHFIYVMFCTEEQIELLPDSIDKIKALKLFDVLEVYCYLERFIDITIQEFIDNIYNYLDKYPEDTQLRIYEILFGFHNQSVELTVSAIENLNQLLSYAPIKNVKTRAERERQRLVYRQWADAEFSKIHTPEDLDRAFRTMMTFEKPISGAGRPKEVRYHKQEWKEPLKTMKKIVIKDGKNPHLAAHEALGSVYKSGEENSKARTLIRVFQEKMALRKIG